ncbi:hypothetical protein M8494_32965 [Serratia ureilytica]
MASSLPPLYALRAFSAPPAPARSRWPPRSCILDPERRQQAHQNAGAALRLSAVPAQRPAHRGHAAGGKSSAAGAAARVWPHIEQACELFRSHRDLLRLRRLADLRWLRPRGRVPANGAGVRGAGSQRLDGHRQRGFFSEPYDCAILLQQRPLRCLNTAAAKLFDEWLIRRCPCTALADGQRDLAAR